MHGWTKFAAILLCLVSCAGPVLKADLAGDAISDFSLQNLLENPEIHEGRLFLLGGIIIQTVLTDRGSLIEAVYVPVDPQGIPGDAVPPIRRFLALLLEEFQLSDPAVFQSSRRVTIAGTFRGNRSGTIEGDTYVYPLFRIEDIRVWEENSTQKHFFDPSYIAAIPPPDVGYRVPPLAGSAALLPGSFPFLQEPDWFQTPFPVISPSGSPDGPE
jgi:starvation-inducible outer membrane lipoprotein